MKLGVIKRVAREDIAKAGGELPKWIDALLLPINEFIEKVGKAIQGQLTFEDNFLCTIANLEFTHDVEKILNPRPNATGNLRAIGVLPVYAGGLSVDKFKWAQKSDGSIGVTFAFDGGTSTTSAKCRLIILLG